MNQPRDGRGTLHSARHKQNPTSHFCLVLAPGNKAREATRIIHREMVASKEYRDSSGLRGCIVYVEQEGARRPEIVRVGELEAQVVYISLQTILNGLEKKRHSEARARQRPGHSSYKPASLVTQSFYIMHIGSAYFLYNCMRLYMEEINELREKLLDVCGHITQLSAYAPRTKTEDHAVRFAVRGDAKDYLLYNVNYMADVIGGVQRMSSEELIR